MKKILGASCLALLMSGTAHADPSALLGLTYNFGGGAASAEDFGFTAKVLSSDKQDEAVAAAGVSMFPWSDKQFGADIGAGYNFNDSGVVFSYDLLREAPSISGGWVNTKDDSEPLPPG